MKLLHATADQYIYFVAVDATDLKTREDGMTTNTFRVYGSRDGGSKIDMNPSPHDNVTEVDATDMPGVYKLKLDVADSVEMTSGNATEELVIHIDDIGGVMAPVTRVIELFRSEWDRPRGSHSISGSFGSQVDANVKTFTANAITNAAFNDNAIDAAVLATNTITADKIAANAIGASEIADNAITAGKIAGDAITEAKIADNAIATEHLATGAITADTMATGSIDAAAISADAGTEIATAVWSLATSTGGVTDSGTFGKALTDIDAAAIVDAVWEEDVSAHQTIGTFGQSAQNYIRLPSGMHRIVRVGAPRQTFSSSNYISLDASSSDEDDFYNGMKIIIYSGTGAAATTERNITDYVGTGGNANRCTVDGSTTTTGPGSRFIVYEPVRDPDSIADHVWDELRSGHNTTGTYGKQVDALVVGMNANVITAASINANAITEAKIADNAFAEEHFATNAINADAIKADAVTKIQNGLATEAKQDSILDDTAEIGLAGAGLTEAGGTGDHLTAIPWNSAWDAEVQSECEDALNAYDPPTKTEMDTAHGLLATEAKQDIIDENIDQIEAAVITNAAGADIAADIIAIKAETVSILADTNELQSDDVPGLIAALNDISTTQVKTQADNALADINLDKLLAANAADSDVVNQSIIAQLASTSGNFSGYDKAIDSLQAASENASLIRTTIATRSSQTEFTLTAGSADNDAYNDCLAVITDATTAVQIGFAKVSDYVGSTKTVTLAADPGFTHAVDDKIEIRPFAVTKNESELGSAAALTAIHLDHLLAVEYAGEGHAESLFRDLTESDSGTYRFTTNALELAPTGSGGGATAEAIADAVWNESTDGHTTSGTFGEQVKTDIDAILVDTGTTLDGKLDTIDGVVDAILVDTGTTLDGKLDTIDNFLDTEVAAILEDTGTTLPATLATIDGIVDDITTAGVTNAAGADVSADIATMDALVDQIKAQTVDSFAELAQGIPTATPTMEQAIMYLYMALRNKLTVTATEKAIYNDAGTKITKKTLSDDGTTYTESEAVSGE